MFRSYRFWMGITIGLFLGLIIDVYVAHGYSFLFNNSEGKFDMGIFWTAIGSISTFLAIVAAILHFEIPRRKKLEVQCYGSHFKLLKPIIAVRIKNTCERKIKICTVKLKLYPGEVGLSYLQKYSDESEKIKFPCELEPGEEIFFYSDIDRARYPMFEAYRIFRKYFINKYLLKLMENRLARVIVTDDQSSCFTGKTNFLIKDCINNLEVYPINDKNKKEYMEKLKYYV